MDSSIVITGMSGKFPDSDDVYEYRDNLFGKVDMVSDDDRRWSKFHQEIPQRCGKINGVNEFDIGFFGMTKRAANVTDPGIRISLEKVYEALLDAGHHPFDFRGKTVGVYVIMSILESEFWTFAQNPKNAEVMVRATRSAIHTNICHFFELNARGTLTDTACSSSMYTIDAAYHDMRKGLYDKAIICGLHLCLHPFATLQFARLGVLSPNGLCSPFDDAANGYVRSESIVTLILERAHSAKRIYAELIHSKTNCDGFKERGITFPSTEMQQVLIREFYDECGIDMKSLDFLEAHGTGTSVGDLEELHTISETFCKGRTRPLLIGTVKSNIGHIEPVSGLCSIVKVLISFESGFIPPNINYNTPRKGAEALENGKIVVVTEKIPWPKEDVLVGINSFGFGGANGHILLRRITQTRSSIRCEIPKLVCVSGRTQEAVLGILDSVLERESNSDFVKLIHQIHWKRIPNHIYSGYSICYGGTEIERSISRVCISTGKLCVVFGSFERDAFKIHEALKVIPYYTQKLQEVMEVTKSLNVNSKKMEKFIIQLILADILKNLNLPDDVQTAGSKIISDFFKNSKTLEDSIIGLSNGHLLETKSYNFSDTNTTYLLIGDDKSLRSTSTIQLIDSKQTNFLNQMLKSLGKLYLRGFPTKLDQLYPTVRYPVGRGTPMISPLIKWDHRYYCHSYKFIREKTKVCSKSTIRVTVKEGNWNYITGHVIDGRNLFPATGYLFLVLEALCTSLGKLFTEVPAVVFEDVKFLRAANVPPDGTLSLKVIISEGSDSFTVLEDDTILVTGNVFSSSPIELQKLPPPKEVEPLLMEQREIYKELRLRGFDYRGEFRAIQTYDLNRRTSVLSWRDNWVAFMDNMLQVYLLQQDSRSLCVPTNIRRMVINREKQEEIAALHNNEIPVGIFEDINLISGGGIEILGLEASVIARKKQNEPVLETYKFVPYRGRLAYNLAVRTMVQTILENSNTIKVKSVEVLTGEEGEEAMTSLVQQTLGDLPLIQSQLKILGKNLDYPGIEIEDSSLDVESGCLIVIAKDVLGNQDLLSSALGAIKDVSGYIISKESNQPPFKESDNIQVLASYETEKGNILLLREVSQYIERLPINITSIDDLSWIEPLQSSISTNKKILLYTKADPTNGTMGLINCLRQESSGNKISAMIVFGDAPSFDIKDNFYKSQLEKNLAINIYKEGKWGSYRHLPIPDVRTVKREHCYINQMMRGDMSSLRWFEGPLSTNFPLENGKDLVQVHYSAMNFRDVMIASGKLMADAVTSDRTLQECTQGFEYSGVLARDTSKRVMGMLIGGALSTLVPADTKLLYPVPDDWSLEDAATVPLVYGTVLYSFIKRGRMKKDQSVLIHSGTGGVGQAAINVATHLGCTIFTTVGTPEKREFIKKHFPSVKDEHIGDSRSTLFEQMIFQQTGGRGVDFVLNSLADEKLRASMRCLAFNGTFLEIGKFDIVNDSELGAMLLKKQARFEGIMLDRFFVGSDEMKLTLGKLIKEGIQNGSVKPLLRTVFTSDKVEEAYRYMATGKHIGKVLIKVREGTVRLFEGIPRMSCNPLACYIILGGLGGFGLELADWLIIRGAKHLILTSRTGVKKGYQSYRLNIFKTNGVNVVVRNDDASTEDGCKALLKFAESVGPVEGIFNLAVILEDALFENQTAEMFTTSLKPKAYATRNLDLLSRKMCANLRYFVVFSSVSCGRGNAGQTNYGMANSVMERICENRKAEGYPALAVQWGAVGDVGLVAEMQENHKEMVIGGTLQQKILNCLKVLDRFLKQDEPVVSSMVVAEKKGTPGAANMFDTVAKIIGVTNLKTVSVHATLPELGMDSMMAIEVKQTLERDFEVFLTAQDIRNMTLAKLQALENNQSNELMWKNEIPQDLRMIFNQFRENEMLNIPLVDLKMTLDAPRIFALPGIEGMASSFDPLVKKANFNISSFQFCSDNHLDSIESLADLFVKDVESAPGKFNILAYSFGCVVAVELMRKLENRGKTGKAFFIDGSPQSMSNLVKSSLPYQDDGMLETAFLYVLMTKFIPFEEALKHKDNIHKCKTYEDKIKHVLKIIPNTGLDENRLVNMGKGELSRIKSLVNYKVKETKLKSTIFLAKPSEQSLLKIANDYELSNITSQPVTVEVFGGNHVTMLENESLAKALDDFFKEQS